MKTFVRDNPMIVASVALPVVVVIVFALAALVPRWLVDSPQYDFVVSAQWPGYGFALPVRLDIDVVEGRLRVRAYGLENGARGYVPRLFEYVAEEGTFKELELSLPANLEDTPDGATIEVPELEGRRLDASLRAPDGYVFERLTGTGGGLFVGLFGSGRRDYAARLRKNGAVVRVRAPVGAPGYYYNLDFLGWLVE